MISVTDRFRSKRVFIWTLFVASSWFFLQTGSVTDRETCTGARGAVGVLAMQEDTAPQLQGMPIPNSTRKDSRTDSMETPSRSLKHASIHLIAQSGKCDRKG